MIQKISQFSGRMAKVEGPARSGKTSALIQRCDVLLRQGVEPESILIVVSSAFAAHEVRERLTQMTGDAGLAGRVRIARAIDIVTDILDQPQAREATGRVPRLLTPFEYSFLLEDVKTQGQPVRRMRKMLQHFHQMMAANEPESKWVNPGSEEDIILTHMRDTLKSRDAMIVEEAPALCFRYLQGDSGASQRGMFAYVLADDFQNLTHAEQGVICLIASEQLIIAGNANEAVSPTTRYPGIEDFRKFDALRRDVATFNLPASTAAPAITSFAEGVMAKGDADAPDAKDDGAVINVKWSDPEEELNLLTKYIRHLLDDKDANPSESRTCVVVPNKRWARMVSQVLTSRGFNVSSAGMGAGFGGDPRDMDRSRAIIAYTKLNLLADPCDLTAWRSWCGFGHALTNSDVWLSAQEYAATHGMTMMQVLETCAEAGDDQPFLRGRALGERWRAGQEFLQADKDRRGFNLLRAIGAADLPEFALAQEAMVGDEDARALYELVRRTETDPEPPESQHVLHVMGYAGMTGTDYDNVFVFGAVDGLMPNRNAFEVVSTDEERDAIMESERRAFYNAVSKAGRLLVVSSFSKSPLELAERTKMQVSRVRSENGERIALVRPSIFLADAGAACPCTIGGQALMAELNLI